VTDATAYREGAADCRTAIDSKPLGEGGIGTVWAALHVVTRPLVAMKFLAALSRTSREKPMRQRFIREAAGRRVRSGHTTFVEVLEVFDLAGWLPRDRDGALDARRWVKTSPEMNDSDMERRRRFLLPVVAESVPRTLTGSST